jgi:DNA repair protein RAD5
MNDSSGNSLVELPERIVKDVFIKLSEHERELYDLLKDVSKRKFQSFVDSKSAGKNYLNVLEMVLRLRQCCDHPTLLVGHTKFNHSISADLVSLLMRFSSDGKTEARFTEGRDKEVQCSMCFDFADHYTLFNCEHVFCSSCISGFDNGAASVPLCPECGSLYRCSSSRTQAQQKPESFLHSSKTLALHRTLKELNSLDPHSKTVVFSQWTSMLDLIEQSFVESGYRYLRMDGTCSQKEREKRLSEFCLSPDVKYLLLSLRTGGVGLNLVAASNVILVDSWWNPAVDNQAIDRVHRIGQTKTVEIRRLVVQDSIEERILELQEKKSRLAQGALSCFEGDQNRLQLEDIRLLLS